MPLDYNAVEEYHVRLQKNSEFKQGRMWLGEQNEWEIEVTEGSPRLSAQMIEGNVMSPFRQFERVVKTLEPLNTRLRSCGTCAHFRRSPHENAEGWIGYCSYRGDQEALGADAKVTMLLGEVSLLSADCHAYQATNETPPLAPLHDLALDGQIPDPDLTKKMPTVTLSFAQRTLNWLRNLLGLRKAESEIVRAGGVERPGGQPCAVCGTRMTNRASVANADKRGNERVLSVWRCPHCSTNYLDDWFEAFIGSKAHDGERLYVVPPVEANAGAAIIVHCPRPDVKGCNCPANQHFDKWGNALEGNGRRIKHRESVVSL